MFVSHAPIHPNRMIWWNLSYVQLTIFSVRISFKHHRLLNSRPKLSLLPSTPLTSFPWPLYLLKHTLRSSSICFPPMIIFAYLDVSAIPISHPPLLTNSHHTQHLASILDTLRITKDIDALNLQPNVSLFIAMLF